MVYELLKHKKEQDKWKEQLKGAYEDNDFVVCTEFGKHQDPRNVLRVMERLCKEANVPKIRFHDLRHTHASILLTNGVDPVRVANRVGHANAWVTSEVYAHIIPDEPDEIAEIFEDVLKVKKKR